MRNGPPGEDALAEEDEAFSSCEDPRGADENILPKNDIADKELCIEERQWTL
jgi:hypothetical protein